MTEIEVYDKSQLGDLNLILPGQIPFRRKFIEEGLFEIGGRKGLSEIATIGSYPYSWWNMSDPNLVPNSHWIVSKRKGDTEAVINVHLGEDQNHVRFFINTASTEQALGILPELTQLLPYSDILRFVIPVPSRDYQDNEVGETLGSVGFEQRGKGVTVAQMYWPDRDSFLPFDKLQPDDRLTDPLTMDFYSRALSLYNENYRIHSFHPQELELGLHVGLVRPNGGNGERLIAVCGRTIPIQLATSIHKVAILRDAVVGEGFRDKGRIRFLASLLAKKAYAEDVDILGLDATNISAQTAVESLGAKLVEYRRWYVAQRTSGGALAV